MTKALLKPSLLNLSVEEENLAAIPFAVLERRVGKRVGKIEIRGSKVLPDGTEMAVVWQVQGNNELGLPTEQDLDIFVALGVLTFRNNFAKTVSFSGREIARILNISNVHGKFYQRLKMAMDRFIPLRFRAIAASEQQETVKWCNVFQEASFSLDRRTGRCTGAVTWTDKLIQSMDSGFFRVLDAGRYMALDGITGKHLYRFLAVAFDKTDLLLIDARKLATDHLGILNVPKYLSRLMQTLEPAFDQLIKIEVLGSYHVVSSEEWRIALRRHANYVPERNTLLMQSFGTQAELMRAQCQQLLEACGVSARDSAALVERAKSRLDFFALERAARLLRAMIEENVHPEIALGLLQPALESCALEGEGQNVLDSTEIALEVCKRKRRSGQSLRNPAGLLVKLIRDPELRRKVVPEKLEASLKQQFRHREQSVQSQEKIAEERDLILEYEAYRAQAARFLYQEMSDASKNALRREKSDLLREQGRFDRMPPDVRERELEDLALHAISRKEVPSFEKWRLRRQVQQVMLPFAALSAKSIEQVGVTESLAG